MASHVEQQPVGAGASGGVISGVYGGMSQRRPGELYFPCPAAGKGCSYGERPCSGVHLIRKTDKTVPLRLTASDKKYHLMPAVTTTPPVTDDGSGSKRPEPHCADVHK